jgi:NAD+ synthase (glutamine-hydrolysing)
LGTEPVIIDIKESCIQHLKDIGHDIENKDVTYENTQARERTQVLMDYANKVNGLVVGTGDLSELALGLCTYNGDQMSMYGVNGSIPKTLVRWMIDSVVENVVFPEACDVLKDILDTPISPELLTPDKDGNITQKTEDSVGPYELHDFFIYYSLRYGYGPAKIYYLAKKAFKDTYEDEVIKKWLTMYFKRLFSQQFKRSCMPDGVKVGSVSMSPRGDLRMPSDASNAIWMKELESLK